MTPESERNPESVRRQVLFSGRVQGVGFRYTTEAIASRFRVTGFVRNLHDGRVEVVAEGSSDEIDRFVQGIEQAMGANIDGVIASQAHAANEFTAFSIAF